MKKIILFCLCIMLSACGYSVQGVGEPSQISVLGDGSSTLRIGEIKDSTLYTFVPYYIQTVLYDEIRLRKMAQWTDGKIADFTLDVNILEFQNRAYVSDEQGETLLNSARVNLEMFLYDDSGLLVWQSGVISYLGQYEFIKEKEAIEEILRKGILLGIESMQRVF